MSTPKSDTAFDLKQDAVFTVTRDNMVDWAIPADEHEKLVIPMGKWIAAFAVGGEAQKLKRTPLQTETKTLARGVLEPVMNDFVAAWVKNNPKIPDEKKIEMYVHIDTGSYHHNVAPTTFPVDTNVNTGTPNQITVDMKDSEATGAGKPAGVLRIESWVFISEAVAKDGEVTYTSPASDADYYHHGNDASEMKATTKFDSADAGKGVYIKHAYSNNVGRGPLGRAVITVIPK